MVGSRCLSLRKRFKYRRVDGGTRVSAVHPLDPRIGVWEITNVFIININTKLHQSGLIDKSDQLGFAYWHQS